MDQRLPHIHRWYGKIYLHHDLEVLALPGISNEGLYYYLQQFIKHKWDGNKFDFVIIEGRLPNTVSIGRPRHEEHEDYHEITSYDEFVLIPESSNLSKLDSAFLTFSMGSEHFSPNEKIVKQEYMGTRLQVQHLNMAALSTCLLAETVSDKVLFFPAVGFKAADAANQEFLTATFDLLHKKFGAKTLPHSFFMIGYMAEFFHKFPSDPGRKGRFQAECGHLTGAGNAFLHEPLYTALSKELDF
ncbi:hypothetical protein N9Q27_00745 [bacterium]|nr:hypothetical protein [bacterium]